MWRKSESATDVRPVALDTTSSKKWNYIRKNFQLVQEEMIDESFIKPAHWTYDELKIPKASWPIYEQGSEHEAALDDIYAALTELAEMIVGGE